MSDICAEPKKDKLNVYAIIYIIRVFLFLNNIV